MIRKISYLIAIAFATIIVIAGFVNLETIAKPIEPLPDSDQILFFDDFEADTLKWLGVGSGSVSRSEVMAFSGDASLNVSSSAWNIEEALRQIGSPRYPISQLNLDFWFSLPSSNFDYFIFGLEYVSAHRNIWFRSGIQMVSGQYETDSGEWIDIEGFPAYAWDISDSYEVWHHASLTVDLTSGEYIEMTVDDYSFDLQALGYKCYDRTIEGNPVLWGVVYPYFYSGSAAGYSSVLIDDVTVSLI